MPAGEILLLEQEISPAGILFLDHDSAVLQRSHS